MYPSIHPYVAPRCYIHLKPSQPGERSEMDCSSIHPYVAPRCYIHFKTSQPGERSEMDCGRMTPSIEKLSPVLNLPRSWAALQTVPEVAEAILKLNKNEEIQIQSIQNTSIQYVHSPHNPHSSSRHNLLHFPRLPPAPHPPPLSSKQTHSPLSHLPAYALPSQPSSLGRGVSKNACYLFLPIEALTMTHRIGLKISH